MSQTETGERGGVGAGTAATDGPTASVVQPGAGMSATGGHCAPAGQAGASVPANCGRRTPAGQAGAAASATSAGIPSAGAAPAASTAKKKPAILRIPIVRHLLVALGFVFTALGAIGVVLPILPTTPFLLLAAACFANGSERFHRWFCSTKLYRNHLEGFIQTRSMPLKTKLCICIPVSAMLIAIGVATPILPMRICLAVLIAVKWWFFIFWIKTTPVEGK